MKRLGSIVLVTFIAAAAAAQPAEQQKPESALQVVGNAEIAAQLVTGNARERVTGRASFHFIVSGDEVQVQGFNVVFFGVDQRLLAGDVKLADPLGMLGFAITQEKPQTLRHDPRTGRISGSLRMYGDASFLAQFARPEGDAKNDLVDTPTLPATMNVTIDLGTGVETAEALRRPRTITGSLQLGMKVEGLDRLKIKPFELQLADKQPLKIDLGSLFLFEIARRLCVQPVRLVRIASFFPLSIQVTGEGLAFGQPGANKQWAKADVVFEYRDFRTLFDNGSSFPLSSAEETELRGRVEDDDCIEVFFIRDFTPQDLHGGGVTFGAGTASSQIISSDANARNGVDFTHLGHELGHVLGLRHPDAPATASAVPANTGTLMCPSGFNNDNPKVNSQGNKDLLSNPLLQFAIKFRSAGPDCTDSADCGACP
jgi:hypothetical protein